MSLLLGVGEWISGLLSIFPKLVYLITMSCVTLLDLFQLAIRKLAGLDTYYLNGTSEQTGDIALSFIRAIFDSNSTMPAVKNAFWSLVILGVIMLIVATIIASIRSEYSGSGNNKAKVIGNAVKSMFLFLIVPVSVLFGLMIGDAFLIAIDKATTPSIADVSIFSSEISNKLQSNNINGQVSYTNYDIFSGAIPANTQTLSGIVFQTAAFHANRVRINEEIDGVGFSQHLRDGTIGNLGIFQNAESNEERARMIDEAFAHNVVFDQTAGEVRLELGAFKSKAGVGIFTAKDNAVVHNMSKFNVGLVWVYYDLWTFNYVIAFAFIVVLLKIMVNIVLGLMKRIIEIVALFLISPPIVAVMPLDDGKTFNKWRETFLARALSVIGVILGFNIFFLLLPYIQQIRFLDPTVKHFEFVNTLISAVMVIIALQLIESFIAIISKMLNSDDPNKAGSGLAEALGSTVKQAAALTGGAAGVAFKAAQGVAKVGGGAAVKGASKVLGGLDKKITGGRGASSLRWARSLGRNKEVQEAKNEASKEYDEKLGGDYDAKKAKDGTYKKQTNQAFEDLQKSGYSGSYKDFMNDTSEEASKARQEADANYEEVHGSRDDYIASADQDGRKNFVADRARQTHSQIYTQRKQALGQKMQKAKSGLKKVAGHGAKAVAYGKDNLGFGHFTELGSKISGQASEATSRGAKGTFKSVQLAFRGMSQSAQGKKKAQDDFNKEEQITEAAKEKLRKEQEEAAKKEAKKATEKLSKK